MSHNEEQTSQPPFAEQDAKANEQESIAVTQAKVELLTKATDANEDEAKLALEVAQGDVREAIAMVNLIAKDIFIIKGVFTGYHGGNCNGGLLIVADGKLGKLKDLKVAASFNTDCSSGLNVNDSWVAFEKELSGYIEAQLLKRNALNLLSELRHQFDEYLQPGKVMEIHQLLRENEVNEVKKVITKEIIKVIKEEAVLKLNYELLTHTQYGETNKEPEEEAKEETPSEESFQPDEIVVYLKSELVIDPISGKTVAELRPGQLVVARIVEDTPTGKYLAELLGGFRNNKEIVPLIVPIKSKKLIKTDRYERYMIEVTYGPGILGRVIISKEIKVEVIDNSDLVKEEKNQQRVQKQELTDNKEALDENADFDSRNNYYLVMVVGIIILIVLALIIVLR